MAERLLALTGKELPSIEDVVSLFRPALVTALGDLPKEISGLLIRVPPYGAVVWLKATDSLAKRRLAFFHEVGHLLLHPVPLSTAVEWRPPTGKELEADHFALALAIPQKSIERDFKLFGETKEFRRSLLAAKYRVTEAAVQLRLTELRLPVRRTQPPRREDQLDVIWDRRLLDSPRVRFEEDKFYTCFLAYGAPNGNFSRGLYSRLKRAGVPIWFFPEDAQGGEDALAEERRARQKAEKVVVVCSADALGQSGLLREIDETGHEDPSKLIPVLLDREWLRPQFQVEREGRDLKPYLRRNVWIDFTDQSAPGAMDQLFQALWSRR